MLQPVQEFQHQQTFGPRGEVLNSSAASRLVGYESWNSNRNFRVQATLVGVNFAWVGTYPGGDKVLDIVTEAWARFLANVQPIEVTRVAIRNINRMSRPWSDVESVCQDFRSWYPLLEMGAPKTPLLHFHRLAFEEPYQTHAQIGQILEEPRDGGGLNVVLDIDCWTEGAWKADNLPLGDLFANLRNRKNIAFFESFREGSDLWMS